MNPRPVTPAIHFALTSHGLGHLTRSLALVDALHTLRPEWRIFISTSVAAAWIEQQLGFTVYCRDQAYEPGAIQRNCFEVDVPATLSAYTTCMAQRTERLADEVRFLESQPFVAVVTDIPALPVAAAARVGVPAFGVSNFTWDWILEPWCGPEEAWLVDALREDYALGSRQLCLPFGPPESSFPIREPAPLMSRKARQSAAAVRDILGLGPSPLAVVCTGGWAADEWPSIQASPGRFQLLTINDLPVSTASPHLALGHTLPHGLTMPDVIAAADVVLGKPGYGLASECLAHRTPFAMIERTDFRETGYLVEAMQRLGRCTTTTVSTFFSGDWEDVLEAALTGGADWSGPDPQPALTIASRILELIDAG